MKKASLLIFNTVFAVICIAAIVLYFISPVWKINARYTISDEQLNEMLGDDIEFKSESGEGVDVNLNLKFDSVHILSAFVDGDANKTVERIVDSNLDNIVAQISSSISAITKEVVHTVAAQMVREELKTQVKNYLDTITQEGETPVSAEYVQALLNESGVTDEYISDKVGTLIDEVYKPDATVDKICDETIVIAKDAYTKLQDSGMKEFTELEFNEENEQAVRSAITDVLNEAADENGNINAEEFVNDLILQFMKELNDTEDPESSFAAIQPLSAVTLAENDTAENTSSTEELKAEIKTFILNLVPLETLNSVVFIVLISLAAILCISLLSWIYLLIKIIVKYFSKNPGVKLKCPIILGWLPYLIFYVLPTVAMIVLPQFVKLPAITLAFASSGMYAFGAAVILVVLWIPYRFLRKKN